MNEDTSKIVRHYRLEPFLDQPSAIIPDELKLYGIEALFAAANSSSPRPYWRDLALALLGHCRKVISLTEDFNKRKLVIYLTSKFWNEHFNRGLRCDIDIDFLYLLPDGTRFNSVPVEALSLLKIDEHEKLVFDCGYSFTSAVNINIPLLFAKLCYGDVVQYSGQYYFIVRPTRQLNFNSTDQHAWQTYCLLLDVYHDVSDIAEVRMTVDSDLTLWAGKREYLP